MIQISDVLNPEIRERNRNDYHYDSNFSLETTFSSTCSEKCFVQTIQIFAVFIFLIGCIELE